MEITHGEGENFKGTIIFTSSERKEMLHLLKNNKTELNEKRKIKRTLKQSWKLKIFWQKLKTQCKGWKITLRHILEKRAKRQKK